jgi:hypothetical protein
MKMVNESHTSEMPLIGEGGGEQYNMVVHLGQ